MTRLAAVGMCLMLQLGCSWTSDPATRLAHCVEAAVRHMRAMARQSRRRAISRCPAVTSSFFTRKAHFAKSNLPVRVCRRICCRKCAC
jgi:hypothetical protein